MQEFDTSDVQLNLTATGFLREAAKWSYFLSIMGFIGIAFLIVIAIFAGTVFSTFGELGGAGGAGMMTGGFITVLYLLIALLYFFPVYYLFKFSSGIKAALDTRNNDDLATAFSYLKSHYKFIGILTIIMLAIYLLIFIVAIIGGIAAFV